MNQPKPCGCGGNHFNQDHRFIIYRFTNDGEKPVFNMPYDLGVRGAKNWCKRHSGVDKYVIREHIE